MRGIQCDVVIICVSFVFLLFCDVHLCVREWFCRVSFDLINVGGILTHLFAKYVFQGKYFWIFLLAIY